MARKPDKSKRITRKAVQESESIPYTPKLDVKPDVDTDGWDDNGLTVRQRSFVDAIVGPAGGNATKAAELAGYASENREALKVTAARLLANANVAKAISLALAKRRLTPEWIKSRLADIANADMNNFMSKNDRGELVPDFDKAVALGAIGQIKEYDAEKGKIKLHDPTPALATLLKLYGLLVERHDHTTGGKPIKAYADIDDGDGGKQD